MSINNPTGAANRAVSDVNSGASKLPPETFKTDAARQQYYYTFGQQSKK